MAHTCVSFPQHARGRYFKLVTGGEGFRMNDVSCSVTMVCQVWYFAKDTYSSSQGEVVNSLVLWSCCSFEAKQKLLQNGGGGWYAIVRGWYAIVSVKISFFTEGQGIVTPCYPSFYGIFLGPIYCQSGRWGLLKLFSYFSICLGTISRISRRWLCKDLFPKESFSPIPIWHAPGERETDWFGKASGVLSGTPPLPQKSLSHQDSLGTNRIMG